MSKRPVIDKKTIHRSSNSGEEHTFFQTDSSGVIISASEQLSSFTGLSIKDLIGSPIIQFATGKDRLKLDNFFRREKTAGTEKFALSLKGDAKSRSFQFSIRYIAGSNSRNCLLNWSICPNSSYKSVKRKQELDLVRKMFDQNVHAVFIYQLLLLFQYLSLSEFSKYAGQ